MHIYNLAGYTMVGYGVFKGASYVAQRCFWDFV